MERKEFIKKYGEVEVTFSHYYKYTFTFTGVLENGSIISVDIGGNADDIYREEVSNDEKQVVSHLEPYAGRVYNQGKEVHSFYDY